MNEAPARREPESGSPAGAEVERRWRAFVGRFVDGFFERVPEAAVVAGRHEHDGRLSDWSPEGLRERVDWLRSMREDAREFDRDALSPVSAFEREYLLAEVEASLFWLVDAEWPWRSPSFYADGLDPEVYVARPYAPRADRLRAFTEFAGRVPRAVRQIRHNLRTPMPAAYADHGRSVFGGLTDFFRDAVPAAFAGAGDEAARGAFTEANDQAVGALRRLTAWFEEEGERANGPFGLGGELMGRMLWATERIDLDLDTLRRCGEAELERNLEQLGEACARLDPGADRAACIAAVRGRKPPDGPVAEARRQLERLRRFVIERELVSIPGHPEVRVEEAPPYMRWNSAYIHIPGPGDADLPSTYYIAPPDESWSERERAAYVPGRADLLFASVHEVWPGHFLHFRHAHVAESPVARHFIGYGFAEGWAHYAEEMMWEAGLEADDAEVHVGVALNALVRTVRYLAAIGLHTGELPLDEAERLFREKAFLDPGSARQQASRGTFDPGYLNYSLGKLVIRKLRGDWEAATGGDRRAFHDRLLSLGGPPLPLARQALLGAGSGPPL